MAQANSAQREPSMEEILASIRRIIEDSDTVRKQTDVEEAPEVQVAAEPEDATEVEAFRDELRPEPEAVVHSKPASLAEIQAEVARERRMEPTASEEFHSEPAGVSSLSELTEDDEAADDLYAGSFPVFGHVQAENQNPRPAILSDHAGRQVAAAFDELSAFAASRRKSFDEMAEEMLRPMLQDWLDNNLPILVERLVREEIERVARGGAR